MSATTPAAARIVKVVDFVSPGKSPDGVWQLHYEPPAFIQHGEVFSMMVFLGRYMNDVSRRRLKCDL